MKAVSTVTKLSDWLACYLAVLIAQHLPSVHLPQSLRNPRNRPDRSSNFVEGFKSLLLSTAKLFSRHSENMRKKSCILYLDAWIFLIHREHSDPREANKPTVPRSGGVLHNSWSRRSNYKHPYYFVRALWEDADRVGGRGCNQPTSEQNWYN